MRIIWCLLLCCCCVYSYGQGAAMEEASLIASLERTTCYGNCPYYEIKIYKDGTAIYNGKKHVPYLGKHQAKLSSQLVEQILKKADAIGYMSLNDKYPEQGLGIIDFPVCITSIQTNNGKKTIYNRNDSPQRLVEYENFFDELLENIKWEKL